MFKAYFLILFLFFFALHGHAQNKGRDSLLTVLKAENQDTNRFKAYFALCQIAEAAELSLYADSLLSVAERLDDPIYRIRALSQKGVFYFEQGENQKALNHFYKALELCKKGNNKKYITRLYNNIANCYDVMGIYDKALSFYFESLKIKQELKLIDKLYITRLNIATVYYNLKQYQQAIEYCNLALVDCIKYGDKEREAIIYHNLANNYYDLGSFEKGISYYKKSRELAEVVEDSYQYASSTLALGNSYLYFNDLASAERYALQALEISGKDHFTELIAGSNNLLGSVYIRQKKYVKAKNSLEAALQLAKENSIILEVKNAYDNLCTLTSEQGDYKKALYYHQLCSELKDSLINDNKAQLMANLQENYEIEKRQSEINFLNVGKLQQEEIIQKQKTISYFVIAFLVLISLLGLLAFNGYRAKRKSNIELELKNEMIEKQKHLVEEHRKDILDSIHYAKRIQNTLLAHHEFLNENIPGNFVLFKPKDIVSGDFYWATKHGSKFYLAVCDSTGHGVPGAFMSLLNINFLNEAINEKRISEPDKIFNYVRERLISSISKEGQQDGFDGILLCIDSSTNKITYVAANNAPLLVSGNSFTELEKDKMPVGQGIADREFKLQTLQVNTGDTLYLYTDGYADQFGGPKGKKFKYHQLNELLLTASAKPMHEQKSILNETLENWKGDLEQVDDVLIIGIKI